MRNWSGGAAHIEPLPPGSNASAPDGPGVRQLTSEVSDAGAMTHLQALQKIADENGGNRAAGTPGYEASVEYVAGVLRGAGFEASTPTYEASGRTAMRSGRQRNVIAQTRTGDPGRVVMIGAHLDSVPEGPGIVDNGSGVASCWRSPPGSAPTRRCRTRYGSRSSAMRRPALRARAATSRACPPTTARRSSCI